MYALARASLTPTMPRPGPDGGHVFNATCACGERFHKYGFQLGVGLGSSCGCKIAVNTQTGVVRMYPCRTLARETMVENMDLIKNFVKINAPPVAASDTDDSPDDSMAGHVSGGEVEDGEHGVSRR